MRAFVVLSAVLAYAAAAGCPNIPTVDSVVVKDYLGVW
jgi:hypothetical protein